MGIVALWPHSGVNPSSSAHSVSCGSEDVIVPLRDRRRCPELQRCLSNNDSRGGGGGGGLIQQAFCTHGVNAISASSWNDFTITEHKKQGILESIDHIIKTKNKYTTQIRKQQTYTAGWHSGVSGLVLLPQSKKVAGSIPRAWGLSVSSLHVLSVAPWLFPQGSPAPCTCTK